MITTLIDPIEGGTVSGGGKYFRGSNLKITACPSRGWIFKGWEEDSLVVSNDSSYDFIISCSRNLIGKFKRY